MGFVDLINDGSCGRAAYLSLLIKRDRKKKTKVDSEKKRYEKKH